MKVDPLPQRRLRLAVCAVSISHFEAPLFRLCAQREEIELKVFYIEPVKAHTFDTDYGQKIDWGANLLAGYDSLQVANAEEFGRAASRWGADVIQIYGYGWPGAAQLILRNWWSGQPQVHRGTLNYYLDPRRPIKGRLMRPFGRLLLAMFDAHHYGGEYSRRVLLDAGAAERSLFFVPYSVDTPYFLSAAADPAQQQAARTIRAQQGWEPDNHVVLFIAQHNWFKGPDIAMKVFRRLSRANPKARFLVVGSGSMTEAMKSEARQHLDDRLIHFSGFIPSAQTVPYYLASDIVLCSSRYETWARMVNEAMLCRKSCVVSRVVPSAGGLIVHDVNGYVVDRPNADLFVEAIQTHFRLSPEERQRRGDEAWLRAQDFAYEPSIDNVIAAARYAVKNSRRSSHRSQSG